MKQRIIGFDLARAYAILGMFIVNFNTVFGSLMDESLLGRFLTLFNGNSSTLFVMLAGMGVALMSNRPTYTTAEQAAIRSTVLRRSWFLFFFGLLFFVWWPADILHFYGGYMHVAALLLFAHKRYYLILACIAIAIFHLLFLVLDYTAGWNLQTFLYSDFWTPAGFIRNTFFNGWNPIFPWLAFFLLGMWLGRLDWKKPNVKGNVFVAALICFIVVESLQIMAERKIFPEDVCSYITADYLPPFLPFMLGTASFGCMAIVIFLALEERFEHAKFLHWLAATGRMTLTHYVGHLTIGIVTLALLTGKTLSYEMVLKHTPLAPIFVLGYSVLFFAGAVLFSLLWSRKSTQGPLEWLMRKIAG
jgi:uncharacterized membrane protein YeiB